MPRPERALDRDAGPVPRLAADLRDLRLLAGNPSYRELAARAGYSSTTLAEAAGGRRLPGLPVVKAYVEACGGDPAEWEERWRAVAAELADRAANDSGSPYLGLASFQPEDADRFFGRARLVEELTQRVVGGGFLAVVGPSGSGKSSLLRAGLLPALAPGGAPLLLTPATDPSDEYRARLAAAGAPPSLVAVDQFEEVFTVCRDEAQRARFIDALLDTAAAPDTTVLVAVRADFYGHCAAYPRLVSALRDATALIGPMSDSELRQAITGPAGLVGMCVERALVTKVLADTAGQASVLPLFSHALLETWRQRQGDILTLAGYEASGGVAGAIARTAEREYAALDDAGRRITRQILTRLTALGEGTEDTRRRVERRELDLDGAAPVVERLVQARLLVAADETVEIAHEALIRAWPRLRGWLTDDRDALRTHRQLTEAAATWETLGRDPGALYRGAPLTLARDWADRDGNAAALTGVERAFLDTSRAAELAERTAAARTARQFRVLSAALAGLLAISVVVGAAAFLQWRGAVDARELARSRQLAVEAAAAAPSDVPAALRTGARAYRAAPTVEARGALLSLASHHPFSGRLPHSGLVKDVAFNRDGTVLAAAAQDGRITLWDVANRRRRAVLTGHDGAVRAVAYHGGGALLASGGLDGSVMLWDTRRGVSTMRLRGHRGAVDGVAFSPDGSVLASIGEDRRIRLWRVTDGALVGELAGHGGKASDVDFSPDGRRLVSAGDDGTAVVWELATRRRQHTLPAGQRDLYAAIFSPDGQRVVTAGADGEIVSWNAATGARAGRLLGHTAPVRALTFAPDGNTLVSAGYDQVALVWDLARGAQVARLTGNTSELYGVAVSPDGRHIASASRDNTVLLWDRARLPFTGQVTEVLDVSVSADGRTLASAANDGAAVVWDVDSRRPRGASPGVPATATPATAAAEGQYVVTRSGRTVTVWDAITARPVRTIVVRGEKVLGAALLPSGTCSSRAAPTGWCASGTSRPVGKWPRWSTPHRCSGWPSSTEVARSWPPAGTGP